jgi:antitoxin ParD1/3/4
MPSVRKSVTVTDEQDQWIREQIDGGRYTNESELIRDLIRREQERDAKLDRLRHALIEGERSGEPRPFDFAAFLRRNHARHQG